MNTIIDLINNNKEISSAMIGAIIGTLIAGLIGIFTYHYKDNRQEKQKINKRIELCKQLMKSICIEIEEGITRCKSIADLPDEIESDSSLKRFIKPAQIYTTIWDSAVNKVISKIDDYEIFRLMHKIYVDFDLINFNAKIGDFGMAKNFAINKKQGLEQNYSLLQKKIEETYNIRLMENKMGNNKHSNGIINDQNQLLKNLRTEYSSLLRYHTEMFRFRLYTLAFFLPAVGLIISGSNMGLSIEQKGLLLVLISIPIWLLELRTRCILPNIIKRGQEIEFYWIENNYTNPCNDIYRLFFCSVAKDSARHTYKYREAINKINFVDKVQPFDTQYLKIFGFELPMPWNRIAKIIINHGFALDVIYFSVIIYGVNLYNDDIYKLYIKNKLYLFLYLAAFLLILYSISYFINKKK